ncbi:hypothetical protein FPQ18DRAFT_392719 [Pyronema domesticum]|uniref:Uncharacterized protein n=1 Tax=Pyronema omphalodes (strain CBS 100304) TaxID=1076935 RepID=U4LB34_PYROM|nr:hypothetical protein FPQ18DRAFT_392719 [Pyronema domesticum]CCX15736.1 Protein of unknown function [Pyronema omphalodes CBS 100304]
MNQHGEEGIVPSGNTTAQVEQPHQQSVEKQLPDTSSHTTTGNNAVTTLSIEIVVQIAVQPSYSVETWLAQSREDDGVRVYCG